MLIIKQYIEIIRNMFKGAAGERVLEILNFLRKPFKYIIIIIASLFVLILTFLIVWYNYCFFPYDQHYLQEISDSVKYRGNFLLDKESDLLKGIGNAKFSKPLSGKDKEFLLSQALKQQDFYIDENPYGPYHANNLKYSTGKIFYYIYQKNSLVLKANSSAAYDIEYSDKTRFVEFEAVLPDLNSDAKAGEVIVSYVTNGRKILLSKNISIERKPNIKPFRYSDVLSSVSFYLKHPGRSVLTDYTGWEKFRVELPAEPGTLLFEFKSAGNSYLFIGSPAVYAVRDQRRNDHVNIVYLVFDTFSKSQIDLYEYYDVFGKMTYDEAVKKLGKRKIITPAIDKYAGRACVFENMISVGQVTRPSIVPLWTSQTYTKSRLPIFRNIVTDENKKEFHSKGFAALGDELSRLGYFTKQISCNAQGHGVSGVGVDLGFDENYDYTMEATEKPENFRRIMEFLADNQNRKFFLYAHINVPHPPRWIPMRYFLSALPDTRFNTDSAKILGNIRYLNDSLSKVFNAMEKLKLMENTIVIVTADHSGGRTMYFRGEATEKDKHASLRESHSVATFHPKAIYGREGGQHLLNDFMNIPWILIKPANMNIIPGKIDSHISSLDIAPTLLDIAVNRSNNKFAGRSFKSLLINAKEREKTFSDFIPLVGRFQRGFILDGRYKYYINIQGLYKYRAENNLKYIMQQEYLIDLRNDPYETANLAHDFSKKGLLDRMRKVYFEKHIDYPDKNFFQISPSASGAIHNYTIKAAAANGRLILPKVYGEGIKYYNTDKEIVFNCAVKDKSAFMSFETDPPDSAIIIYIYKDGRLLERSSIYSSVEHLNYFGNPLALNDKADFHIAREPGRTGLEKKEMPEQSVFFSRIPLNYWMEMNMTEKDIKLSPGIKEVLKGWGYIQ